MILQDNPTYWWTRDLPDELKGLMPKMNENARNRALKPILEQSFIVEDQHEGGESAGGIEPGKMDLRIRLGNGDPWSILEALIIYEESGSSKKRWIEHLERMATRYNKSGFRNLILVSYLEAPAVQFGLNKEAYHRYLNETDLPEFGGKPKQCEYEHIPNCPGRISVSRAHYTGGAGDVTIFHFLVHIPEYRGKQDKEKESASAE